MYLLGRQSPLCPFAEGGMRELALPAWGIFLAPEHHQEEVWRDNQFVEWHWILRNHPISRLAWLSKNSTICFLFWQPACSTFYDLFFIFLRPDYPLRLLSYYHENTYSSIPTSPTTLKIPWAFASSILMSPGSTVHTTYKINWPSILCLALLEISEVQRRIRANILDLNLEKSEMVWL